MRAALAADPAVQSKAAADVVAASSGAGAWWASAQEVAMQLLGVELKVVLAAAFGAFLVRSYLGSTGVARTLASGLVWTGAGSIAAPLVAHYIAGPQFLPGVALAVAGGGQVVLPWVIKDGWATVKGIIAARFGIRQDPPQ